MMNPSYPAGSGDSGDSSPAPSGGRYRRRYLGTQTIAASGTWSKADALALPLLAGRAEADIEVDVECVGGGASGWHGLVRGGAPGAVVRRTRALADLPSTVPVSVGAGGPVPPSGAYSGYSNAGGSTSFGDIVAGGGMGVADGNWGPGTIEPLLPASDVPLAMARMAGTAQGATTQAAPAASHGSGAGGAGIVNNGSSGERNGTPGGASGAALTSTRLEGGALGQAGRDAQTEWQYGSGGGGAGRYVVAGKGGFPGGGGGGGRTLDGGGYSGWDGAGPGGAGVVRLPYYVWEAV